MRGLGLLILRLALGVIFILHGVPKIISVGDRTPADTAALLDMVGVSSAYSVTVATGLVEVLGGGLLVAGAYTMSVTLLLGVTTAVTSWLLYLPNGFFLNWSLEPGVRHGYEYDLLRLSALICLLLIGPGVLSYDARSATDRDSKRGSKKAVAS